MIALWTILLPLIYYVDAEPYRDCGSKIGSLISLTVTPCDKVPCALYKGQNSTITIEFSTKETVKNGHISVHGIIAHVPVPFVLDKSDLCEFVSPTCPLIPSIQKYTHTYSLHVNKMYPSISLTVRWELQDSSNEDVICVEFPVQLI
ncbi:Epididymal secretory protein isoform 2 [Schistosoma japonicum]|uniref:Epididymal secretory protein E1 (Niemann Pick type C2 protein homolog) n=1 Tax=Schistosoma japonicum TaxID=6182 RepID=Q5DHY8_SCHJA|nr:SJCHGC00284 protein [Schistosoma japonicum]KAH8869191.1 NPC intracellular cholesterol transporter 2 [Schistosoma japonicum]TNN09753.1 Epididymal secretory protein isoform 2 [Schistosoma japonicum]TNN09754.1 Epididymal secretory protein isoform 2 [Schistosoma japonicum]CAX71037.1 Epididymal secretory protein E1 precursor (Niemann Pick type C2 protein homolog) [Schistosoma japonicum]